MIATSAQPEPPPGLPKYRRVAHVLRWRIHTGVYEPGGPFPSEPEIETEFGISRGMVRQAVGLLRQEGLVDVVHGIGATVRKREHMVYMPQRESRPHPASAEMDRFSKQITDESRVPGQVIKVELVAPPAYIAERLKVDPKKTVVARLRIRMINGQPVNTNDSYFRLDHVNNSEIMDPADIPRGTNQALVDLGHAQVRAIDEITARMPTPEEMTKLGLGAGTPVLIHLATGYDADGTPVRCTENVLDSTRHVIVFERSWE